MNVGLPAIGRAMHASGLGPQWVINIYFLPLSALLFLGGSAGDRYGRRRLLVRGTSLFAVASAGCALAPSLVWLLIGRCLQGMGAAALMPTSLAILATTFSGEARGRAIGIWASAGALMAAVGPLLGVTGASLLGGFQGAVLACAVASATAGICAFILVQGRKRI